MQTDRLADGRIGPHIRQAHTPFLRVPLNVTLTYHRVHQKNLSLSQNTFLGHPIIFDIVVNLECLMIFVYKGRSSYPIFAITEKQSAP